MLTKEGAGKTWLQVSEPEQSNLLSLSRPGASGNTDGMCAGASSDELLFQAVTYLEAQRCVTPPVPCLLYPPPNAMHRSPSFSAESGVILAENERESSNCPPTSDSSVEESSSAQGVPPSSEVTPLISEWMQYLSPDTGGLDLLTDVPDEWPAAAGRGALGENTLLAPLDGSANKQSGVGGTTEAGANEGVDSIWQRISANRGGGVWDTPVGAAEKGGVAAEGPGLSTGGVGLTGARQTGAPPRASRFRPPDELRFSNAQPLQRSSTISSADELYFPNPSTLVRSSTMPPLKSLANKPPNAGAMNAGVTPPGPTERDQVNAAGPVSMDFESLSAAPWMPPPAEAPKPPRVAPAARHARAPEDVLPRTRSDPAGWLQSYDSGEGLLADALCPPRVSAPRHAPLERQRSVPALPVSSALGMGGALQRQTSAPEAEVAELLGEQILRELRRRRDGQAPSRGGLAKPKLTPSQMQLILDQHRIMLENQPPEAAWRGGSVLDTVTEGVPANQPAMPAAWQRQLAGPDGQLAAASARPKADKRRRGGEGEWAGYAQPRDATRELAETRAALPGGRDPVVAVAGLGGSSGHRGIPPGSDGLATASHSKLARQSRGAQGALGAQAGADAFFWGQQIGSTLAPPRGAVPLNEPQPDLRSRAFLPAVGLQPAPLPGFETITVPALPRGSSPDELPCAPHERFVVPVGPNLAHVMEIFRNVPPPRGVEPPKPLPAEMPSHPGESQLVSPRTQLPGWETWAFEEGLADMDFADTLLDSSRLDM